MVDRQHPITPPPELVQQWLSEPRYSSLPKGGTFVVKQCQSLADDEISNLVTKAARWGADQELEACCKWMVRNYNYPETANPIRTARRPKPPSLNEVALQMLSTIERDAHYLPEITDTIRRALEQLDD